MTDRMDDLLSPAATVAYRVRFDECTASGTLRSSAYLRYAQDIAWIHSERVGCDRAWYARRGIGWLVRGIQLIVSEPSVASDELVLTTRVVGFRRVLARRRADVRTVDGRQVALVLTDYVMIDERGVPARVPNEFSARFGDPREPFVPTRVALPGAPPAATVARLTSRPHELDPMGHVNHAAYLDWVDEVTGPAATVPRLYRLEYLLPVAPASALVAIAWSTATGWAYRLTDVRGNELFRAIVEQGPEPPGLGFGSAAEDANEA